LENDLPVLTRISYSLSLGVPPVSPQCFGNPLRGDGAPVAPEPLTGGTSRAGARHVCANCGTTNASVALDEVGYVPIGDWLVSDVARLVKKLAERAGIDAKYAGHSLR